MNTVAFMDTKLNDTACNLSCHTIVGSFDLPLNSRLMFRNEQTYNMVTAIIKRRIIAVSNTLLWKII